jgi:hypothetical protein
MSDCRIEITRGKIAGIIDSLGCFPVKYMGLSKLNVRGDQICSVM